MKNIPCCALVCLPCVCMSVYACRILEGFIDFVLDISLLWNMFHFVCVLFWRASHAKALPSSRRLAKILSLSLSVSLSLNFVSKQKECSRNCKRIDNVSTTSLSFGRKKNNQNVHNIRRRFIGGETKPFSSAHNKICKIFIFFFFLLLALKIIRRLRLFDTPILSVFLKKSRPFRHHSTAT